MLGDGTILEGNEVHGNTASAGGSGRGGGVYLRNSSATLEANSVQGNHASVIDEGYGGGLAAWESVGFRLTNNIVAGNHASIAGSGLWFSGRHVDVDSYLEPTSGEVLHSTIVGNGPDDPGGDCGQGVYVGDVTTVWFTNTIIAGHRTAGLVAAAGGTAELEATLWHDNGVETTGSGSVDMGTVNTYADPLFVEPSAGDYHLDVDSPAVDVGIAADVSRDVDGEKRPQGRALDIGADEYPIHAVGGTAQPLVRTRQLWVGFVVTAALGTAGILVLWRRRS